MYRWWTVMWGRESAIDGYYLKLGPLSVYLWDCSSQWALDICFLNRWCRTYEL
jgi:hypothetical protein